MAKLTRKWLGGSSDVELPPALFMLVPVNTKSRFSILGNGFQFK
jgi:hypothetical protein